MIGKMSDPVLKLKLWMAKPSNGHNITPNDVILMAIRYGLAKPNSKNLTQPKSKYTW